MLTTEGKISVKNSDGTNNLRYENSSMKSEDYKNLIENGPSHLPTKESKSSLSEHSEFDVSD